MPYRLVITKKIEEFIIKQDEARQARIGRVRNLFETYGLILPSKYLKKLDVDIWELRPGDIRIFIKIIGSTGYAVHIMKKKTQKTPHHDLELAIKRGKEIIL